MKKFIAKKLGLQLFDILKGYKVTAYYNFYLQTLKWNREEIENHQLVKLRQLLNHAYQNVPFYKKRFDEINFDVNIKSLSDLENIPPLTREDIQNNFDELLDKKFDLSKCYKGSSSGSTGQPVFYYHDVDGSSSGIAANYFGWFLGGWEFGQSGITIWGNPRVVNVEWKRFTSKIKSRLFFRDKFPAYKLTETEKFNELIEILKQKNYSYIDGYTNAIYLLADYVYKKNIKLNKFKQILTTGENLQDYQRAVIENVLGPVYDGYGCGEINGIAHQCKICKEYHIIEPHVIVESNDNISGEDGSSALLITDLTNYVMPLIRYQNGDMAVLASGNKCSIKYKSLHSISGRISDVIDLPGGGNLVVPSFFGSMLLKQVTNIKHYQIEKVSDDKIIINLVLSNKLSDEDYKKISDSLYEYLGKKLLWEIKIVDKIQVSKTGKFKLLVDRT